MHTYIYNKKIHFSSIMLDNEIINYIIIQEPGKENQMTNSIQFKTRVPGQSCGLLEHLSQEWKLYSKMVSLVRTSKVRQKKT